MHHFRLALVVIVTEFTLNSLSYAQKSYTINYATKSIDGSISLQGPSTIVVTNLNQLRYVYKIGGKETVTAPPSIDLSSLGTNSTTTTKSPTSATPSSQPAPAQPPAEPKVAIGGGKLQAQKATKAESIPPEVQLFSDRVRDFNTGFDGSNIEQQVTSLLNALDNTKTDINAKTEITNAATRAVNLGTADILALLSSSDSDIQADATGHQNHLALQQDVNSRLADGSLLRTAIAQQWGVSDSNVAKWKADLSNYSVSLSSVQKAISTLQSQAQALEKSAPPLQNSWGPQTTQMYSSAISILNSDINSLSAWSGDLSSTAADISALAKSADALAPGSTSGSSFVKAQTALTQWMNRLHDLSLDLAKPNAGGALSLVYRVTCKPPIAGTKQTVVSLTVVQDNYALLNASISGQTPPQPTSPSSQTLVTVTCNTPFVIAAGVAFSSIPDREFGIQQIGTTSNSNGSTTPTNVFSLTADSSFHPVPIAAVHVRFADKESFSFYGTIGIAANIKGQNSGGSSAEYLIGPTVGAFRYVFLTPGLYVGRENVLGGGFKVGGQVPSGVTTPPLQTSYKPGFGVAITFSK